MKQAGGSRPYVTQTLRAAALGAIDTASRPVVPNRRLANGFECDTVPRFDGKTLEVHRLIEDPAYAS